MRATTVLAMTVILAAAYGYAAAGDEKDPSACPMHAAHQAGAADASASHQMDERGGKGMGFDQKTTAHHFTLLADGGSIAVDAMEPAGVGTRDQIRAHLRSITTDFAEGDFSIPMFVHAQTVPGTETMKRLRSEIRYTFEEAPRGGRVRIASTNPEAVQAVHDFLKFQIVEHRTGDSLEEKP
jgi:hypothetical protein